MPARRSKSWGLTKPPVGYLPIPQEISNLGIVGAWLFNQGAGLFLPDLINVSNATPTSTGVTWIPGSYSGSALSFDGSSGDLGFGAPSQLANLRPMSICTRLRLGATTGESILDKSGGTDGGAGWWLLTDTTNHMCFGVSTSGADIDVRCAGLPATAGTWFNFAMTWNGSLTALSGVIFYVDGVAQAQTTSTNGSGVFGSDAAIALTLADIPGAFPNNPPYFVSGFGLIDVDWLTIHSKALTQAQVLRLANERFYWMQPVPRRMSRAAGAAATDGSTDIYNRTCISVP